MRMTGRDSLESSYRENVLEHVFAGEIMKAAWLSGKFRVEMFKPQVDAGGYDLILEANGIVRHIQLKSTFSTSKVKSWSVNALLREKPSGCVVIVVFDSSSLRLGPFRWFGATPGSPLPPLGHYPIAKHTKANALGVKLARPNIRKLPRSAFTDVPTMKHLVEYLFGSTERK